VAGGPEVVVCRGLDELSREAAERFVRAAQEAAARSGRFSVALSGGSTPRRLYELLAQEPYRGRVPWPVVHVFFGDERCVPPDHEQSNYRMARDALLGRVPLAPQNVHRMEGEREPEEAADRYEQELRRFFGLSENQMPRFDLVLLGLGADGHTASLFPGTPAVQERHRAVVPNRVADLGASRLTLSLPALNAAAQVLFLVAGRDKAQVLRQVLSGTARPHPAQMVRPEQGTLVFLVDRQAYPA
jgi:6-phosphogluconolactonase